MRLRLGLLTKVVLALGAVGLIPLGVASVQLVSLNREAMETQVLRTHAVAARNVADRAAAFLDTLEQIGEATARSPKWAAGDPKAVQELLLDLLEADPRIAGVVVTDTKGGEAFRVQRKAMAPVVERVVKDPSAGAVVAVPVEGGLFLRREFLIPAQGAHLTLVVDGAPLRKVVTFEEIGEEAYMAIASRDRLVIASTPSATLAFFPPVLLTNAASQKASGGSKFSDANGQEALGAWAPVNRTDVDWFALSRQPVHVAEQLAIRLRRRAGLAVAAALVLTALLCAAAYRTVVRPLRQLARAQRRLTGRPTNVAGNEIEDLRKSFELLERQAADQADLGTVFLGRYQVLKVLGSGGMGTVFRGWDPKLKRPVALKTVRSGPSKDASTRPSEKLVTELLNEAVTIARFSHPNIVAVYDVADSPEAAFIAMELVDGFSLHEYLKRVSVLKASEAVPLGAAVASALAAAHAHHVVHHDIKPGNVLLGKDGSIKVTDFGIAQVLSERAKRLNAVFGTPGYIPPETLRGEGYDEAGDLFALGAVLYRCLTGMAPFTGKNAQAVMNATVETKLAAPGRRAPGIPAELDALIMRLLEKDRARRPDKAGEIAEELQRMAARAGWRWAPSLWEKPKEPTDEDDEPASGLFPTSVLAHGGGAAGTAAR